MMIPTDPRPGLALFTSEDLPSDQVVGLKHSSLTVGIENTNGSVSFPWRMADKDELPDGLLCHPDVLDALRKHLDAIE